jgi:integrase
MPGLHFHDLRHTGNTLADEAGASLRELMDRMGRSTTRPRWSTSTARRCGTR